jgi:hypothetical protein
MVVMTSSFEEAVEHFAKRVSRDKLRFAICGNDEKHSGTWSVWGNKNDFYIGARSILGSMKVSLHASGICRVALTEGQIKLLAEQGLEAPVDRAFVKWKRRPTPEVGAAQVVSLIFPTAYFRLPAPVGTSKKPMLILGAQPDWSAVEIGFFYSREPASQLEPRLARIGNPMFRVTLESGDSISIVARDTKFDLAVLPNTEMFKRAAMRPLTRHLPEQGAEHANLTAAFFNKPTDGEVLQMVEVGGITLKRN